MPPAWSFHILTFGCKVNQSESESLREAWLGLGGAETDDPACADYILVNSCAITGRAERNCRNAIFRLRSAAPRAKIILTGCAAQFYHAFRPRRNANHASPDLCIPQKDKNELLAGPFPSAQKPAQRCICSPGRARPVVKIQDGCTQGCSYCIVPQIRAMPVSKPAEEIIDECRALAAGGCGEIVLSGVNLRQYRGNFWALLATLDHTLATEFGSALRLRISSLDPGLLNATALATISTCKLLCPHLHLSLQHASPAILKAMRRPPYSVEKIRKFCDRLTEIWPIMGLGADIIAGFPGEREADLSLLLDFITASRLSYAHVFPYSRRQGTSAAEMLGQIPKAEKLRRAERIRAAVSLKQQAFLEKQLELTRMLVIADAPHPDKPRRGVNEYYADCIFAAPVTGDCTGRQIMARPVGISAAGLLVVPAE